MTRSNRVDATTQNFVDKAWNIGNFEIQAGREAQNKANTQDFLDYARRIVIPILIDQNSCAQSRSPMDMMRHGCSTSLFHASQQ
jgi:predicted outer membrane protein